jgi:hypothetical protein
MGVLLQAVTAASVLGIASLAHAQTPYATQPVQPPPPPSSANAGNGEYVAPLQQQTQQTYVPQSVALSGPAEIKNYSDGDPIPPGYHPVSRMRTGLFAAGIATFGSLYLISALTAAATIDVCKFSYGQCISPTLLLVPVAGPFIEIGHSASGSALAITVLVIDGIGQVGGVTMAIAGLTWPKVVLRRNDLGLDGKKSTLATIEPVIGAQSGLKITF